MTTDVSLDDVERAAAVLAGVAHHTPVVTSRTLNESVGAMVFLKCENLQRMGAFKFRGAYNAVSAVAAAGRSPGVVAFSSGNHAQAVALAARLHGLPAIIVMPSQAPTAKLAATRGYGADVVTYDLSTGDREAIAADVVARTGYALVPPFDDPAVIAGQGTAAMELLDEVAALDVVVAPVGGGGLLAGTAVAVRGRLGDGPGRARLVGVEPEAGDDGRQSLLAGRRIVLDAVPDTIADGQQTTALGHLPFAIMRRAGVEIVTVDDDEIVRAMVFLFERTKLVVEPSGATGVAALLAGRVPDLAGRRVGVIVSGGNVDAERFGRLVARVRGG